MKKRQEEPLFDEPVRIVEHKYFICNNEKCHARLLIETERLKEWGSNCRMCGSSSTEAPLPYVPKGIGK